MKILQVMAGAEHGGAETAYVDMCVAMHEAGENIQAVTRPNDIRVPRLKAAGVPVHCLPFGGKLDVYTPFHIMRIIKNFQPHIVQSWMSRAPSKVTRWKKSMKVPRYVHVARLGSPYKMKYFRTADYFASITPDIRQYIINHGIDPTRVRHINNFADIEPAFSDIKRSDFDTPDDAPLVLGLGRLHDDKAFDTLIKVAEKLPGIHVWIAGEGPDREMLENMIAERNLQARVKLLGWQSDRAALFSCVDICAFISREEGFGTVFVQSWAQKTPVVVSDADGPRQFVRHEEDGLMAPIDDVAEIASCIHRVIDDLDLRERIVRKGYARYEQEFTKQASLQGYLQYYHDIIGR